MKATRLLWVMISLLVSGCAAVSSSDVKPSAIFTQYQGSYDQASNQISFTAVFFVGGDLGTYVQLDSQSSITLDASPMTMDRTIFNQIIYEADQTGALNSPHTYVYTDDSGAVYRNTITIPTAVTLIPPASPSISGGFSVSWQTSNPLGADETVQVTLSNSSASAVESDASGSGEIYFSPTDLQQFSPGSATLKLCRINTTTAIEAPASGGEMTAQYCATPQTVSLTR